MLHVYFFIGKLGGSLPSTNHNPDNEACIRGERKSIINNRANDLPYIKDGTNTIVAKNKDKYMKGGAIILLAIPHELNT